MEELIKTLEEIKEHQLQTVQLARTTTVYKLAEKAINQALSLGDVVGRSEQFYCYEQKEYKNAKCEKQCKDCLRFEKYNEQ